MKRQITTSEKKKIGVPVKDKKLIPSLSDALFWDVDPEVINPEKHALYVIERVLSRGSWDEFKAVIAYYGKKKVAEQVTQLRYLDKIVLAFCITYFNIPKENFKCFTKRQLHPTHWNY